MEPPILGLVLDSSVLVAAERAKLADLIIGACALELGYAIATENVRDFCRIPDLKIVRL
jgi:predicted nucleic acid-binding protein